MRKLLLILTAAALGLTGYLALSQESQDHGLPPGEGRDLVLARCQTCHDLGLVTRERLSKERWEAMVQLMVQYGMQATEEEIEAIVAYLATHFGPQEEP